jgi:hypothetical protein
MTAMKDLMKRPIEHISAILPRAMKTIHPDKIDTFIAICSLWDEIVGKSLSDQVRPAAYKEPLLIVHVNSSAWIHHLQFTKKEMIERINKLLKKTVVTDIKCKIGPV